MTEPARTPLLPADRWIVFEVWRVQGDQSNSNPIVDAGSELPFRRENDGARHTS
jgi:hypothetical protein